MTSYCTQSVRFLCSFLTGIPASYFFVSWWIGRSLSQEIVANSLLSWPSVLVGEFGRYVRKFSECLFLKTKLKKIWYTLRNFWRSLYREQFFYVSGAFSRKYLFSSVPMLVLVISTMILNPYYIACKQSRDFSLKWRPTEQLGHDFSQYLSGSSEINCMDGNTSIET